MTENYLTNPWFVAFLGLAGLFWVWLIVAARRQPQTASLSVAARHMATARQMRGLSEKAAARTAKRLGAPTPGLPIGRAVRGGMPLVQDWESCSVDIAGTRTGKTTSRVIPVVRARRAPCSQRVTSATCSTRPAGPGANGAPCTCSIRKASPTSRPRCGGTRSRASRARSRLGSSPTCSSPPSPPRTRAPTRSSPARASGSSRRCCSRRHSTGARST